MKTKILCLSVLLIITAYGNAQTKMKENINCKKALKLIQKHSQDTNFVILDVRTPEEFVGGHIENAILIDYKSDDFQDKISKLDPKKTYLVYCRRGGRSSAAIGVMKGLNFNNLVHLYEGIEIWQQGGYKTVTD